MTTHGLAALSDTQMRRSIYMTMLLAALLPPLVGSTLMGLVGFYPFPEIYLIFLSYTGPYVAAVVAGCLALVPRMHRFIVGLTQMDRASAEARAQRVFRRLPWVLLGTVTLYSMGGAFSADLSLEAMDIRHYNVREHLYNQFGLIPVVLITSFPIFFYFVDNLGRYLGPRGISITAIPLWVKLLMLGLVTPLLIDSLLIGYFLNRTGYFEWQTLALWFSLLALAAGGTWLAWRSLRQGIAPLQAFIDTQDGTLSDRARTSLTPLSLDELGVLTTRYAELLSSQQQLSGDLQRSRVLAESVIDHAGALVVVLDREGRILNFNHAAEKLSGYSFSEVAGKHPWETVLPPEDAESVRNNAFESLVRHPEKLSGHYTNHWLTKSGERALLEWFNTVVLDTEGRTEVIVSVGIDITARQRSEEALRQNETLLRHTQRIAQTGSWELDLATGALKWSEETFRIFGRDPSQHENSYAGFLKTVHPEDRELVDRTYRAAVDSRTIYDLTHRIVRPDGTVRWVHERGETLHDEQGKALRTVGGVQDVTERRTAEAALAASEARLRTIINTSMGGVLQFNTDGIIIGWDGPAPRLFGWSREEALGLSLTELIVPARHRDAVTARLRHFLATGDRTDFNRRIEATALRRDGNEFPVEFSISPIPCNQTFEFCVFIRDITDRKRAEEIAHASNQLINAVLDTTPVLIAYLDPDMAFVRVNAAYAAADQKDPAFFVGKNHFDLFPNADNEAIFRRVAETGVAHNARAKPFEYEHNPERGVSHWDWSLTPVKSEAGKVTGLVLSLTNVSERIEALEAAQRSERELKTMNESLDARVRERTGQLVESEKQLRHAQQIARLGHWQANLKTGELIWSDEIFSIFGRERSTFQPSIDNFFACVHPDDISLVKSSEQKAFGETGQHSVDHRIVRPDGSTHWVHEEARLTRDSHGNPWILTGTVQDITDRKLAEAALIRARDSAERANQAKNTFLSRMSHELRTPMNAILGFAQVLEMEETIQPEQKEYAKEIHSAGDHLLELINELLDLSRIESGKLAVAMQPVELQLVLSQALHLVQQVLNERQIALLNRCTQSFSVLADSTRLRQILVNLLTNAAKYNRLGGQIELDCRPLDDMRIQIRVRDTGIGIAPEKITGLFQPFERLGAENTAVEGTGIGLALSKQLAELMGMQLGVESAPGQGSTFWINARLAEAADAIQVPIISDPAAAIPDPQKVTLLYIEDNAANLKVVEAVFQRLPGIRLLTATNGEFGLELARRYSPDAILLDIHLPGMNGYDVLKQLHTDTETRDIPVIALTADAMPIDIETGLKAGFRAYLTKPFKIHELTGTLMNMLGLATPTIKPARPD